MGCRIAVQDSSRTPTPSISQSTAFIPALWLSGIWVRLQATGNAASGLNLLLFHVAITSQGGLAISHAAADVEFGPEPKRQGVGVENGRGGGRYINRIWE